MTNKNTIKFNFNIIQMTLTNIRYQSINTDLKKKRFAIAMFLFNLLGQDFNQNPIRTI